MRDLITVQGVVLSAMPVGEYDKRIVLLTRERGKISAFAKGARRLNSPFMAAANPFVFGNFTLYEGRSSYNLNQVSVTHHFVELAGMQPGIYYGYYFLELADYFGREGTDEREMMNLLYVTVKALLNPHIEDRLVRCIFELRTMAEQGLCPQVADCASCGKEPEEAAPVYFSQQEHGVLCASCAMGIRDAVRISGAALYAMQYIVSAPMGKLYTFSVKEDVLLELEHHIYRYTSANTDRKFKSLQILEMMCR
ncbi:MAG: DNA repair protein RecO [Blautia sp.]|nr:DNA repair protein RecO [Blautia sp.]MDY4000169.1 DNA repair protein RecO [Blautia sp.]